MVAWSQSRRSADGITGTGDHGESDGDLRRARGTTRALAKRVRRAIHWIARRECFDQVIVFNEAGLHRLIPCYCSYHERSRTHLSLDKNTPVPRPVTPPEDGVVVAISEVGGLHHRYERRAA
jgi:hypothetical protein